MRIPVKGTFLFLLLTFVMVSIFLNLEVMDRDLPAELPSALVDTVFYLKMQKCASETLSHLFRRYAFARNLNVLHQCKSRIYLGWPYRLDEKYHSPVENGTKVNIVCDHMVFNQRYVERLMPGARYVTSVREPFRQFRSMFYYYKLHVVTNMSKSIEDPVALYLRNLPEYEAKYKSHEYRRYRHCVPDGFSMSYNLMSFNLGFETGFDGTNDQSQSSQYIQNFLEKVFQRFDLIIVVELLDESLILLKHMFNWHFVDILYISRNSLNYNVEHENEAELRKIYESWSNVDHQLYSRAYRLLQAKILSRGEEFQEEVLFFKSLLFKLQQFCEQSPGSTDYIIVRVNRWSDSFNLTEAFCKTISPSNDLLHFYMKNNVKPPPAEPDYC